MEKDEKQAVKWYTKAAEQGDMAAQFNLGVFCEMGFGVRQSANKAVSWYSKAAAQGHEKAQAALMRLGCQ